MRIKSYFAATVEEAMDKARRELGSEAMLMNSKKTNRAALTGRLRSRLCRSSGGGARE